MDPADIHLFKVSNGNTRTIREICSTTTIDIKTTSLSLFGVFVIFEQYLTHCSGVSIVDNEQVNTQRETLALNGSMVRINCLAKKSNLATRV